MAGSCVLTSRNPETEAAAAEVEAEVAEVASAAGEAEGVEAEAEAIVAGEAVVVGAGDADGARLEDVVRRGEAHELEVPSSSRARR